MKEQLVAFVVPPRSIASVVSDYAGGLGFEAYSNYVLPPLDLLQLAAIVRPHFRVALFDFAACPTESSVALDIILQNRPHLVVLQADLPTIEQTVDFARRIRVGGVRTLVRIQFLNALILRAISIENGDEWLVGECENDIVKILEAYPTDFLFCGRNLPQRPYRHVEDLSMLPPPAHDLLSASYQYPRLGECFTVQTSRGCPFLCGYYCPYPLVQGNRWRRRPLDNVVAEIKEALGYGLPPRVFFRDAVFTLDADRTIMLCSKIIESRMGLSWWCETRVDLLIEEVIQSMAQAGCIGVNIGIETGDEDLRLRTLKQRVTDSAIADTCTLLRRNGIAYSLLFMCGWPSENKQSLVKTGELIASLKPVSAGVVFPTAYPGTHFHADLVRSGRLSDAMLPTSGGTPQIPSDCLSMAQLQEARRLIAEIASRASNITAQPSGLDAALKSLRTWAHLSLQEYP